jgi:hypothetical protein
MLRLGWLGREPVGVDALTVEADVTFEGSAGALAMATSTSETDASVDSEREVAQPRRTKRADEVRYGARTTSTEELWRRCRVRRRHEQHGLRL